MAKNITSALETRNNAPDFSKYDIDLVTKFSDKNKNLLDLGAGGGLLVNAINNKFQSITAVELYPEFSQFILPHANVTIINSDIKDFHTNEKFNFVISFGVMNFFSNSEASNLYKKMSTFLKDNGTLIVKHQMGLEEDVVVDTYSDELKKNYYSNYRSLDNEKKLIEASGGLVVKEVVDIYPDKFNRWDNTHFYAIIAKK